jgi:hypothetical protein
MNKYCLPSIRFVPNRTLTLYSTLQIWITGNAGACIKVCNGIISYPYERSSKIIFFSKEQQIFMFFYLFLALTDNNR